MLVLMPLAVSLGPNATTKQQTVIISWQYFLRLHNDKITSEYMHTLGGSVAEW